jgi:signal transduction histidine kinase
MRFPYRFIGSFKGALFVTAVGMLMSVFIYTDRIVMELRQSSRDHLTLQVERFRHLFVHGDDEELDVYLHDMATKDFPLIVADENHRPTSWSGLPELDDIPIDDAHQKAIAIMADWVNSGNLPLPIEIPEYGFTMYFYYGDSAQINRLQNLPWIEGLMVGGLILIGYLGFVAIKRSEERSVWVGMARETAHQMGTPLTSLMGWIELLVDKPDDPQIPIEMQHDIERLKDVAERFNRIGSTSSTKSISLNTSIESAVEYIRHRLPQLSQGEVKILLNLPPDFTAKANRHLLGWVFENLLRNGVEALQGEGGIISVTGKVRGKRVIIDVKDQGVEISRRHWRDIFRPGYSTKKRGWGLGLSLAKRIIEDVHKGKISVHESRIDKGTTIRVQLIGR